MTRYVDVLWWDLGRLLGVLAIAVAAVTPPLVRWWRRPKQAAEKALAWFCWNWATGGKVGTGPEIWDREDDEAVRRRLVRASARVTGTIVVLALAWYRHGLGPVDAVLAALGTAVLGPAALWLLVFAFVWWWHWWRWVLPLRRVLRPMLGWPDWKPSWRWLTVPRSRSRQESKGWRVTVPKHWYPPQKEQDRVVSATLSKLRLDDVTDKWVRHSRYNYLLVRPAHHAPATAFLSDPAVQRGLASMTGGRVLLGLTAGGKKGPSLVDLELDNESPHVLLSAGTGGGKSATIRALAAQGIRRGWHVWVIDVKRHSHRWMHGLPGVRYFRDIEDVHLALLLLEQEGDRRNRAWDDVPFGTEGPSFPRVMIICEEINATANKLRKWWRMNRGPGDPQQPESVAALGNILFMGRAVQIHVIAVAQMATAKDLGGPENRENFFARILARYTPNAWKILVPECAYTPATSHPGRAQVCIAGVATETQMLFMSDHEARAYALAGRDPVTTSVAVSHNVPGLGEGLRHVAGATPVIDISEPAGEVEVPLMSIAELSADKGAGIVPVRYDALRQALLRDRHAPQGVKRGRTHFYVPAQVEQWHRNRPIAGARERQMAMAGSIENGGSDE